MPWPKDGGLPSLMAMYGDSFGVQNRAVTGASSAFSPRPGMQRIMRSSFAGASMAARTAQSHNE